MDNRLYSDAIVTVNAIRHRNGEISVDNDLVRLLMQYPLPDYVRDVRVPDPSEWTFNPRMTVSYVDLTQSDSSEPDEITPAKPSRKRKGITRPGSKKASYINDWNMRVDAIWKAILRGDPGPFELGAKKARQMASYPIDRFDVTQIFSCRTEEDQLNLYDNNRVCIQIYMHWQKAKLIENIDAYPLPRGTKLLRGKYPVVYDVANDALVHIGDVKLVFGDVKYVQRRLSRILARDWHVDIRLQLAYHRAGGCGVPTRLCLVRIRDIIMRFTDVPEALGVSKELMNMI